ncbi:MAG: CBS domain-containing protein [Lachnospiraceae bacterium]
MNILFFLTPKAEVACVDEDSTLRQALEKLENSGYAALPIISKQGKYIGTITEGDMLWYIKNNAFLNLLDAEDIPLQKVKRKRDNKAVSISEDIESLWEKVMNQNFVPVVDDDRVFIGIVTRRDLMAHIVKEYRTKSKQVTA